MFFDAQVALCTAVAPPPASMGVAFAVALLCAHNYCLSVWPGWEDWVVSEHRDYTSFIDMNKEGILSLPSYWAVYLLGQVAGRSLLAPADIGSLQRKHNGSSSSGGGGGGGGGGGATTSSSRRTRSSSTSRTVARAAKPSHPASRSPSTTRSAPEQVVAAWHSRSKQLGATVGLLWICTLLTVSESPYGLGLQPSRRLLNASYTCWLLAQCGTWLLSFLLLELYAPPVPQELEQRGLDLVLALSGLLLPTFLVANIATVRDSAAAFATVSRW